MPRDRAGSLCEAVVTFVNLDDTLLSVQDEMGTQIESRLRLADAASDRVSGPVELMEALRDLRLWLAGMVSALRAADLFFRDQPPAEHITYDQISDVRQLLNRIWSGMPSHVFDTGSIFKVCFPSTVTTVEQHHKTYETKLTAVMKVVAPYHHFQEILERRPLDQWPHPLEVMDATDRQAGQSDVIRKKFQEFYGCTYKLLVELLDYLADHVED